LFNLDDEIEALLYSNKVSLEVNLVMLRAENIGHGEALATFILFADAMKIITSYYIVQVEFFSNAVHEVIAPITCITESENKSIMEVNGLLDSLAAASDQCVTQRYVDSCSTVGCYICTERRRVSFFSDQRKDLFKIVIKEYTAEEQKWLICIILQGELLAF
jgi:hypothetical protein